MRRFLLLLCLAALGQSALGMIVRASLDDMVRESADIVQGRVLSRESRFSDDGGQIVTEIEVAVDESWLGKASAGKTLRIQTLGGIVGDVGEMVEHQPQFALDEEVLLFVDSASKLLNDEQGKFSIGGGYIVGFDLVPHDLSSFRQQVQSLVIQQEGPR